MGAVDVRLGQVELAAELEILGDRSEYPMQRPVLDPLLEAAMARLVRRIPIR